jgi:hypothetical protein
MVILIRADQWEVGKNRVPDDLEIDIEVGMHKAVEHARDQLPGHFGMGFLGLAPQPPEGRHLSPIGGRSPWADVSLLSAQTRGFAMAMNVQGGDGGRSR